jgi:hypothetical protein
MNMVLSKVDPVRQLGFWSAALTAMIAALHFAIGIMTPARSGPFARPEDIIPYPYTNVASFIPIDYVWLYPGFLLALVFIVLVACIHNYASVDRKIFSQISMAFAMIYAAVITIDYFIQFTVAIPSLLSGETAGLSLFTQYSPHGIFIALEGLGYMMMSMALLFAAFVFTGGKLERAIRGLLIMSFILSIGSFFYLSWLKYDVVAFEVTVLTINWIVLIVMGAMLSILFRRASMGGVIGQ